MERVRPQCRRLEHSGIKDEDAPPPSSATITTVAQHHLPLAGSYGQWAAGVPFGSDGVATDLGEYTQRSTTSSRLRLGRNECPWVPIDGLHSSQRDGAVESRCDRATTCPPGCEHGAPRLHPWGGVL